MWAVRGLACQFGPLAWPLIGIIVKDLFSQLPFSCDNAGITCEQNVSRGRQKATKTRQAGLANEMHVDSAVDTVSPGLGGIFTPRDGLKRWNVLA